MDDTISNPLRGPLLPIDDDNAVSSFHVLFLRNKYYRHQYLDTASSSIMLLLLAAVAVHCRPVYAYVFLWYAAIAPTYFVRIITTTTTLFTATAADDADDAIYDTKGLCRQLLAA